MSGLDTADLVVIAGRVLGIGTDAALARIDLAAARAALAEAQPSGRRTRSSRAAAAAACTGLMDALLRHRPFPQRAEQLAVAAALQHLSLNGWRADLDPPATAAVVVEALAAGRLSPADAADWLSGRLSRRRPATSLVARGRDLVPHRLRLPRPHPFPGLTRVRALASLMLAISLGGLALLAAACASGPAAPPARPASPPHVSRPVHQPRKAAAVRPLVHVGPAGRGVARPAGGAWMGVLHEELYESNEQCAFSPMVCRFMPHHRVIGSPGAGYFPGKDV
ncbi:MAG TPA: hypothetical protein VHU92_08845 [Streptosporangiaceae bacterium]|jgi:hypothetical protein|nr:hypothetical protein [Streptosporangiaceae bacterium]